MIVALENMWMDLLYTCESATLRLPETSATLAIKHIVYGLKSTCAVLVGSCVVDRIFQ